MAKPEGLDLYKTSTKPAYLCFVFCFYKLSSTEKYSKKKISHPKRAAYQLRTVAIKAE
jgi:hypothetical protein